MAEIIVNDLSINTGDDGLSTEQFIDELKKLCKATAENGRDYYLKWEEEA